MLFLGSAEDVAFINDAGNAVICAHGFRANRQTTPPHEEQRNAG